MISSSFYFRYYFIFLIIIIFIIIISIPVLQFQNLEISDISKFHLYSTSKEFTWPLPGFSRISSPYGQRKAPTIGASSFHYGIDLPAPCGTAFVSSINGKIIYAGFDRCKRIHYKSRR